MSRLIGESVKAKIYELEEAATKDYNDSPYLDEYLEGYRDGLHQAAKELSTAPTIEAVPVVHGEWNQIEIIDDDSETGVNDDASQCSVCGYVFDSHYWAKTYFKYCPNCGAKMDGKEKRDD